MLTAYLLVLVNVNVLGVYDVVFAAAGGCAAGRAGGSARSVGLFAAATLRARALVERLGELVRGGLEVREGVVHAVNAALFQSLLRVGNRRLDLRSGRAVELLLVLREGLLDLVDEAVQAVARLDLLALLGVVARVRLGLAHHPINLILRQTGRRGDRDLLLAARAHVFGRDVDDAVGVNVERDLDLRHAARRGRDADEVELAQGAVVRGHRALALEDVHLHARLVVRGGREDFRLARRDRRVARDEDGVHPAERLDAQRERRHVEQKDVGLLTRQHARLDCRPEGDPPARVDRLVRLLAEVALHHLLNFGGARGAADQD